jgi:hypothetical protein
MKNEIKYNFADFTLQEYTELIRIAKENYTFRLFNNFERDENYILWRHDVDFSMHSALDLAIADAQMGIQSTFFLLPHSEFYNLLEKESIDIAKRIIDLAPIGIPFLAYDTSSLRNNKHISTNLLISFILLGFFCAEISSFVINSCNISLLWILSE